MVFTRFQDSLEHGQKNDHNFYIRTPNPEKFDSLERRKSYLELWCFEKFPVRELNCSKAEWKIMCTDEEIDKGRIEMNWRMDHPEYFVHNSLRSYPNQVLQIGLCSQLNHLYFSCLEENQIRNGDSLKLVKTQQLRLNLGRMTFVYSIDDNSVTRDDLDEKLIFSETRLNWLHLLYSEDGLDRSFEWWKSRHKLIYVSVHIQETVVTSIYHNSCTTQPNEFILDSCESLKSLLQLSCWKFLMGMNGDGSNLTSKTEGRDVLYSESMSSNQNRATTSWMSQLCILPCSLHNEDEALWRHVGICKVKPKVKMKLDEFGFQKGACLLSSKVDMEDLTLREAHIHEGYMGASRLLQRPQKAMGAFLFLEGENDAGAWVFSSHLCPSMTMLTLLEDQSLEWAENGLNGPCEDGLGGPKVARDVGLDSIGPCDLEGKRSAQHPMLALQGTRGLT